MPLPLWGFFFRQMKQYTCNYVSGFVDNMIIFMYIGLYIFLYVFKISYIFYTYVRYEETRGP